MKFTNSVKKVWHRLGSASMRSKVIGLSIITATLLLVIPVLTYAYFARDIAEPERLMNRNNTGIALLDRNGEMFYNFGNIGVNDNLTLAQISDDFEHALLASEDEKFYEHRGYSMRGVLAALYANVANRNATKYGGSTITQQLVKNTLLSSNKNYLRKYQEVSMAIAVERKYTKDEILQMYINSVYFGEGAFGVKQAAKAYFNKDPKDLNVAESAMLVGLLPAPSTLSPVTGDPAKAKEQQERVLRRMTETGHITNDQKNQAGQQQLVYAVTAAEQKWAQHFALMVIDELKAKYGEETITRGGYRVTTGLDLSWQKQTEQLVKDKVAGLRQKNANNAALVAVDPKTGEIRALVGSADWNDEKFGKVNMATSARQPGSSIKPIYYAEAMEKRLITPATIIKDEPKVYGTYRPQNYDFRFRGDITVRRALGQSLNIPALEVMQKLGVENAVSTAQRMGIEDINEPGKYGLTLALGTAEAKLTHMTNAYAAFANQGSQYPLASVVTIKDKYNKTIFTKKASAKKVQSPEASFLITSVLADNQARAPTFGSSLNIPNRQVAVKTGTTDEYRDAWTIGYTPSLTVGVWVGNSDNQPMAGVAGSAGAGIIWRSTMMALLGDSKAETFVQPASVIKLAVCHHNGLRADRASGMTYDEYFIKGGEPTGRCVAPKKEEPKQEEKKEEKKEEEKKKEEQPVLDNTQDDDNTDAGGRGSEEPEQPTTEEPPVTEAPAPSGDSPAPTGST